MGVSGAERLQDDLLAGLPADTPVAVIQNASLPTQRQLRTTLGRMAQAIASEQIGSPAVIVVGDVARAAQLAGDLGLPADTQIPPAIAAAQA
jgi:uroporphyrin-III C-methyltransferase